MTFSEFERQSDHYAFNSQAQLQLFREHQEEFSNQPTYWLNLLVLLNKTKMTREAVTAIQKLAKKHFDLSDEEKKRLSKMVAMTAWLISDVSSSAPKNISQAIDLYKYSILLNPKDITYHQQLIFKFKKQKNWNEMMEYAIKWYNIPTQAKGSICELICEAAIHLKNYKTVLHYCTLFFHNKEMSNISIHLKKYYLIASIMSLLNKESITIEQTNLTIKIADYWLIEHFNYDEEVTDLVNQNIDKIRKMQNTVTSVPEEQTISVVPTQILTEHVNPGISVGPSPTYFNPIMEEQYPIDIL